MIFCWNSMLPSVKHCRQAAQMSQTQTYLVKLVVFVG